MHKKIKEHFRKKDRTLYTVIEKIQPLDLPESSHPTKFFENLCREIVGQQLSGKAADTIYGRFVKLFPKGTITPKAVLKIPDKKLRAAGMSWSKVSFIKDLAKKVSEKEVLLEKLTELDNPSVIAELTKIKGIGPWTAEMFLMFTLGREDVFSHGDLGLRKAIKNLYKFKKDPTKKQIEKIAARWVPYRTYASRILWESLEIKA